MHEHPNTLPGQTTRAFNALVEAHRLANSAEAIRYEYPPGYRGDLDRRDRPVEALMVALDETGAMDCLIQASRALEKATALIEEATAFMNEGITRWEGVRERGLNPE